MGDDLETIDVILGLILKKAFIPCSLLLSNQWRDRDRMGFPISNFPFFKQLHPALMKPPIMVQQGWIHGYPSCVRVGRSSAGEGH